jgi:NOL1/NOP2/sun family putative RNA methylase
VRVNTLKISVADLRAELSQDWEMKPVTWCPEGFFLTYKHEERYDFGNLPEHQLGYLYIQDAASMIPPVVLAPEPGMKVLDLCAAPGSKTTQLAAMMKNTGVLVANDVSGDRLTPLGLNIQRCGVMNTIIVLRGRFEVGTFDRVLVDAPCSGTGTVRRSLKTLQMWSPGLVARMVAEQRKLIEKGWEALAPGGVLVYSTCTQEPEENEGMISWFLSRHADADVEEIALDIVRSDPVPAFNGVTYDSRVARCLRIYPQDNDTEGFFVAKLRKASR